MSDLDLATADILDCQGHVTHRLVLQPDGTVTITFTHGGHRASVDPRTRRVLTPGMHVPDTLLAEAATLHPW